MVGPSQVRPGSNSSQPGQIPVSRPVKWGVRGRSPLRPDRLAGPFTHQHPCMRIQMSTASPLHWARGAIKGEQTPINGRPASGHGVFADSLSLDCSIGRVRLKNSKNSYPRVPGVTSPPPVQQLCNSALSETSLGASIVKIVMAWMLQVVVGLTPLNIREDVWMIGVPKYLP